MGRSGKVLLMSGGLDCAALWPILGRPDALYCGGLWGPAFDANGGEYRAVRKLKQDWMGDRLTIREVDFRPFKRTDEYHFPREPLLCMIARAMGYDTAILGWVAEDHVTQDSVDRQRRDFMRAIGDPDFRVEIPAWNIAKKDLVRMALKCGVNADYFRTTYSCTQRSRPCGRCKSCRDRREALAANGISV